MKITKTQLKQIIKEELEVALKEGASSEQDPSDPRPPIEKRVEALEIAVTALQNILGATRKLK